MAKEEDNVAIVKKADYIPEIEEKVKLITAQIHAKKEPWFDKPGVPRVDKKYKHIEIPEFGKDLAAQQAWQMEEIRRCIHGYDGMPGNYYFYFNHCFIKNKDRGKIRPDFRTMDLEWFKFLEKTKKGRPVKGIVCIKRRQIGMSWKAAADMIYSTAFNRDYEIGFNSKTEADSRNLFLKVKYIYRNQSPFLKIVSSATDRRDAMFFSKYGKDEFGNKIVVGGTESSIISVSPTPVSHSGNQYKELICDEAGETEEIEAIWSNAEDCIVQDGIRTGLALMFGTMGQADKAGKGLMEFWLNHEIYDFDQFGFWGYNELIMDELGNDNIEESVRAILYKRKKLENGSKTVYNKFIQRFPLNQADAFLTVGGGGVGNPLIIGQQELNLFTDPPLIHVGRMKMVGEVPVHEPNPQGHMLLYELPLNLKNGYRAVLDPAEDDDVKKSRDNSDLGFTIAGRAYGMLPLRLVAEYCHRPMKLEEAYLQFAMACKLYGGVENGCKITIEMNKGGWRAFKWFEQHYPELLELTPRAATSFKGGFELKHGVKKTPDKSNQMEGLLNEYIDNYCLPNDTGYKGIPSKTMLKQFKVHGSDHEDDDISVSWGWQLILDQADKRAVKHAGGVQSNLPTPSYKMVNGVIQIVNSQGQSLNKINVPRNPLFYKG